ncbi:uncharacterized protein ACBT57_009484 isoform 1-T1 [Dama dama]
MLALRGGRSRARAAGSAGQPCWAGCARGRCGPGIAMAPSVPILLGLVFFRDPGIWAQTDLPEVYQNPLEEIALPVVSGSSAIGLLPLLFVLLFILCLCCCGGQHGSADNETKSQLDFNSSNPGMDFSEENPHDVSVHLPLEEDRQTDMHAHPEECPWGSSESSAEPHQDSFTQSELSLPSCSPEESSV